ncbi:MAG: ATP/GTP-binding protein [Ktedonobacterales bacterium]|nr:MAG: ATP/GTP-binding protein [Ktedonobacterales bacterium]
MALAERRAEVTWEGNLTQGKGTIESVGSGALQTLPITWASRVEKSDGRTSPEELIAAAHASCYAMAFSNELNKGGTPPARLHVTAVCTLDRTDAGPTITAMALEVTGSVPGLDQAKFTEAAETAKKGCPVSRALQGNVQITVNATLEG